MRVFERVRRGQLWFVKSSPHVNILTMLEAIRASQDNMADEVSGNIIGEMRKRGA